jgi:Integrase core domain
MRMLRDRKRRVLMGVMTLICTLEFGSQLTHKHTGSQTFTTDATTRTNALPTEPTDAEIYEVGLRTLGGVVSQVMMEIFASRDFFDCRREFSKCRSLEDCPTDTRSYEYSSTLAAEVMGLSLMIAILIGMIYCVASTYRNFAPRPAKPTAEASPVPERLQPSVITKPTSTIPPLTQTCGQPDPEPTGVEEYCHCIRVDKDTIAGSDETVNLNETTSYDYESPHCTAQRRTICVPSVECQADVSARDEDQPRLVPQGVRGDADHPSLTTQPTLPDRSQNDRTIEDLFSVAVGDEEFNEEVSMNPISMGVTEAALPGPHGVDRKKRTKLAANTAFDERIEDMLPQPAGERDWPFYMEVVTDHPTAFKFMLRDKGLTGRGAAQKQRAAAAKLTLNAEGQVEVSSLYDSGAATTQIPNNLSYLLHDVHEIEPIEMTTAGTDKPVCDRKGWLVFQLEGLDKMFKLPCLINPSLEDDFILMSLDCLERSQKRGDIQSNFWNDEVVVLGVSVPIVRDCKSPTLRLRVNPPGLRDFRIKKGENAMAARQVPNDVQTFSLVHRICAHAHYECCLRTAAKDESGLPSLRGHQKSTRPCPECTLAKLKAPSKGQGNLSTNMAPTKPGQVMCSDVFGPISIPGLSGERYFVILVCQLTSYGFVRVFTTLDELPDAIASMTAEAKAVLGDAFAQAGMTVYSDNATVYTSKRCQATCNSLGVNLSNAASYEARTNPYAERYGQTMATATRALLLEGSYPPKFWSIMVRVACWTVNRLVRADDQAPIETFALKKVDFSKVHPTGVLCYWHVGKQQRDGKLANTADVGVYLGNGGAVQNRGHLVLTTANKIRVVSHLLVDNDCKPFKVGLLREMLNKTAAVTSVFDKAAADPEMFRVEGASAFNYIGKTVKKLFGKKSYTGTVRRIIPPEEGDGPGAELWYQVVYSDGDVEEYTLKELKLILVNETKQTTAAAAEATTPQIDLATVADVRMST